MAVPGDGAEAEDDEEKVRQIGLGFRAFLKRKREPEEVDSEQSSSSSSEVPVSRDGICTFRGSIVDVKKLMNQLERSERARVDSEARAADYLKSLTDLREASEKHTSVRDKLQVYVQL